MSDLYPLKFKPIYKERIWGGSKLKSLLNKDFSPLRNCGESWDISGIQENLSVVCNGFLKDNNIEELIEVYMGDLVGEKVYEKFGIEFPLLIKFIDANDDLSIQVHPGDELAKEQHSAYGKTEMWYVLQADEGARLISGFNREVDEDLYLQHLQGGTFRELLNEEEVSAGDAFFIPAGRVHAVGKGIVLAEIQQVSDVTYRINDFDRVDNNGEPRELHTELAKEAIDYRVEKNYRACYQHKNNRSSNIVKCEYFTVNVLSVSRPVEKNYNLLDSFVIHICLEGDYNISFGKSQQERVGKGETALIPASIENITVTPIGGAAKLLEVYI